MILARWAWFMGLFPFPGNLFQHTTVRPARQVRAERKPPQTAEAFRFSRFVHDMDIYVGVGHLHPVAVEAALDLLQQVVVQAPVVVGPAPHPHGVLDGAVTVLGGACTSPATRNP